ncbi:P1 family peptidase [Tumebacillus sp. DT12]|uniref:P1 family peptidase n=1 Tax=Tumebacillus lacus TaxID=2995335 RepID=A0ABT3X4I2_9BACL|nr:P1 family peptidase [Tumebacillus lacus]MCX7570878.1 P1 family peptidase [Tumebacillus lacus]
MTDQKRLRDYEIPIGTLPTGARNAITDVPGVRVGHVTLDDGPVKTGVTAILPHGDNVFREKVLAAYHVINGFGKSTGLVQIEELGTIETPILLTNTLSVGTVSEALVRYKLARNEDIGIAAGTVNPLVLECNDGYLNDIRGLHVRAEHVFTAIANASEDVAEGAVGAGTGMSCYQLKGGIGTSSRVISIAEKDYTVGVLVLSNFGRLDDLRIDGQPVGRRIIEHREQATRPEPDKGSIILIVATDLPVSERQLKRLAKRTEVGLVRTGSYIGHGSGDIAVCFSTAQRMQHEGVAVHPLHMLDDSHLDPAFRAVAESTEEAILNSMIAAHTTVGRDGHVRESLRGYLDRGQEKQ